MITITDPKLLEATRAANPLQFIAVQPDPVGPKRVYPPGTVTQSQTLPATLPPPRYK